jgi:hypothetical protein
VHCQKAENGARGAVHEIGRKRGCASQAPQSHVRRCDVTRGVEAFGQSQEEKGDACLAAMESML